MEENFIPPSDAHVEETFTPPSDAVVEGQPLKKKEFTQPSQMNTTPFISGEQTGGGEEPVVSSKGFILEAPSIKNKQSELIKERTKQQFLNNPLFQESNPNAQKNKEIYINTLVNKGYKRSDLELEAKAVDKTNQISKEKGFWDKSEAEISKDFWDKTFEAAKSGYDLVKQAFTEPLTNDETGKPIDSKTPLTDINLAKPVTKIIVGGSTTLASPIIAGFEELTQAIKDGAEKTLPEPAAKVVGEALPTIFSLGHKAADALGYVPEQDSAGEYLLSILDMIAGGKVLHAPIEGIKTLRGVEDLKEISKKASEGKLTPEQMKSYEDVVGEIKNTSLADIKKAAEQSNTPQGDVIAAKIGDIETPSGEHIVSPDIDLLEKQKADLETDKQKLDEKNPGAGQVLEESINEISSKLEEAHNREGDLTAGEGLNNVIHNEIDSKISELELSKEGLSESGKESIDKQIQELKTQKDALQIESPSRVLQHSQEGIGETRSERQRMEQGIEGVKTTETSQEKEIAQADFKKHLSDKGLDSFIGDGSVDLNKLKGRESTNVSHAETAKMREALGMAPREKAAPLTQEMREKKAEEWMKEGGNIERLLSDIENKSIEESVAEKTALNKYLGGLKEKAKTASGEDLNKIIDEQKRVIDALDKTGSEAGSLLQLRKDIIENDDSLLGFLTREKISSGVDILTEGQERAIKEKYAEYEAALEKEKKANEELQSQIDRYKAGENVKSIRRSTKVKKTHEQYVAERKEYINSAKEKLAKLRQSSQAAIVPYANELIAITPEVGKLVKSLAEEGIDKLDDVVKAVHKEFKELVPDLTEKDVLGIIAGEFKEKKTREMIATDLENLKAEAKLISKLEQLKSGEKPVSEKRQIEYNQKVKELKDQIKALKKENSIVDEAAGLEKIAERNKKATEELERRMEARDFEPRKRKSFLNDVELKKKFPEQYKKALDSWIEKNDKKLEFEMRFVENQRMREKAFSGSRIARLGREAVATAKSIQAGVDLSAIFVQNARAIMANPVVGIKGIIHQFKDLASSERFERGIAEIHNSEAWPLIKKSGLEILDPKSLKASEHEDYFSDNYFKKKFKINGNETHLGKYTIDAFERAYTSLGNYMRVELFLREVELLESQGKTFETHEKLYKDIAKDINNSTGRGHLPPSIKAAQNIINPFIWSSRLMASALNTLALSDIGNAMIGRKGYYGRMEPEARKFAITQTAKMAGTGLAVMAVYKSMGYNVDLDPRSPTFGTIQDKDGFTYNVFSQLSPYVRLAAELVTGQVISHGEVKKLGERGTTKTKESELIKFIRGRTTPLAGTAWSAITGKNYDKSDFDALESAKDMITPMSVKPLYESIMKDEPLKYTLKRTLGITGLKVSHPKDFEKSKSEKRHEKMEENKRKRREDRLKLK